MKQTNNNDVTEIESNEIYTRHAEATHFPASHNSDCPIIFQHDWGQRLEGNSKHFATIFVAKPGENLFGKKRVSLPVSVDGQFRNLSGGIFAGTCRKGSFLISKTPFPALAELLHAWTDNFANYKKGASIKYSPGLRVIPPTVGFQLLQEWNEFEDRGLSWEERWVELGVTGGYINDLYGDFQNECKRLGLVFGQKASSDHAMDALNACLGVLEGEHRKRIAALPQQPFSTPRKMPERR